MVGSTTFSPGFRREFPVPGVRGTTCSTANGYTIWNGLRKHESSKFRSGKVRPLGLRVVPLPLRRSNPSTRNLERQGADRLGLCVSRRNRVDGRVPGRCSPALAGPSSTVSPVANRKFGTRPSHGLTGGHALRPGARIGRRTMGYATRRFRAHPAPLLASLPSQEGAPVFVPLRVLPTWLQGSEILSGDELARSRQVPVLPCQGLTRRTRSPLFAHSMRMGRTPPPVR